MGAPKLHSEIPMEEKIHHLQEVYLFESVWGNNDALRNIAMLLEVEYYKEGEKLINIGDRDGKMYILYSGCLDVTKLTNSGDSFHVANIRAESKAYVGEGALLHDNPRSTDICASTDSVLFSLSRDNFKQFCENNPKWANPILIHLATVLSKRLRKQAEDYMLLYNALVNEVRGHQ
jgi:CRP-like cAMP-binding protein